MTDRQGGTSGGPERYVIVADDEPHIGRIIKMKLEQGPFRVTLVYDGEEAIAALSGGEPVDLVMLDLMMPRRSGLDVLAFLRTDPRLRETPCIILTAAGQEAQHRRALELGASDFITKPFSPKKLYQRALELSGLGADADLEEE
ncbi:MAG TPA: response regulator [Gemmatimonadales bacterium]